jgi:hypothetical protein
VNILRTRVTFLSGHHYLTRLVQNALPDIVYDEHHQTGKTLENSPEVHLQKTHDFSLNVPKVKEYQHIVQIREFSASADSWKVLVPDNTYPNMLEFYHKFMLKWVYGAVPNRLLVKYEDLVMRPLITVPKVLRHLNSPRVSTLACSRSHHERTSGLLAKRMNYTIGSGYYNRPNAEWAETFFVHWQKNILRFAYPLPQRIFVVAVGDSCPALTDDIVEVIRLKGNLGHGHQLIGVEQPAKPHAYSGWSGAFLSTAMLAYCNETDFVWQEQDCLGFGDYIGEMYRAMGDRNWIVGGPMKASPFMPSHQSLVLIRHHMIPTIVRLFLDCGDERSKDRLIEHKFAHIAGMVKWQTAFLPPNFVDRMRPLPINALAWSAQQFTADELDLLKRHNLI